MRSRDPVRFGMKFALLPLLLLMAFVLCHCGFSKPGHGRSYRLTPSERQFWQELINEKDALCATLTVVAPYNHAVFPPEIAAPTFLWEDRSEQANHWLIALCAGDEEQVALSITDEPRWTPEKQLWETLKARSTTKPVKIALFGVRQSPTRTLISQGMVRFCTSKDPVGASIFYRQVPLPFPTGVNGIRKMKWRMGDIASYEKPRVVMENVSVCASCHQFSRDGRLISMEMNYGHDNGAQFIVPVEKTTRLSDKDFMTWSGFPKPYLLPPTRGLFAKLSPDGRALVGTVNEISFFALTNDAAFCQLMFPTYGILAWYDADTRKFARLPGADDLDYVQTDPCWSQDGKQIVFARVETHKAYHDDITDIRTRMENADILALNEKYPIQFDLYRMAFNNGLGGVPEPIEGASRNGMSNYFARYSPDGRWIVFTRSRSGIMLQPDSELYMIPASGGKARRMRCNRNRLNSWHSFSPNGRWMLFSSKANSIYTEIFLTHIDENGMDSVPVCLSRFSDRHLAANVPEFVNLPADAIGRIVPPNE